jgi:hypothetical protein
MKGRGRASFLKKRSKKFLVLWAVLASPPQSQRKQKFLRRFFQKAATSCSNLILA